jgi:pimeloyl-ACP methyl ester carboxylesterase
MSIDASLLEARSLFENKRLGVKERFLVPSVGGGYTFAVLSEPLGDAYPMAWVLCHSFGHEQIHLQSIDTPLARSVAAAGFPVLRFHSQGYGDSEFSAEQVSLSTHVRDAIDAVSYLIDVTGVSRVGLMGARFGGSVAALAADRIGAAALVVWDPIISGSAYLRFLLRKSALSDVASGRKVETSQDREKELGDTGVVDLQGVPVTRETVEELRAMDLLSDIGSFDGQSLVVQVSSTEDVKPLTGKLAGHLQKLGGSCSVEVVVDRRAQGFGGQRFRPSIDRSHKVDTQEGILTRLTELTTSWTGRLSGFAHTSSGGVQ